MFYLNNCGFNEIFKVNEEPKLNKVNCQKFFTKIDNTMKLSKREYCDQNRLQVKYGNC